MKFLSAALLLASLTGVSAFSAVAPEKKAPVSAGSIDRTMEGIDAADAFDPTEGDNSALTRNNNGEVWVSQVHNFGIDCFVPGRFSALLLSHPFVVSLRFLT